MNNPTFNLSEVKCNGSGYGSSVISTENKNAIQTYVSVYRKTTSFEDLVYEMANQDQSNDYLYGHRCKDDSTISYRIYNALGVYAMNLFENSKELSEMWINAQIEMFTGATMTHLVKDALRDCAGADHWYTYEKDWN
jgi:hypothetical protein